MSDIDRIFDDLRLIEKMEAFRRPGEDLPIPYALRRRVINAAVAALEAIYVTGGSSQPEQPQEPPSDHFALSGAQSATEALHAQTCGLARESTQRFSGEKTSSPSGSTSIHLHVKIEVYPCDGGDA